jgi:small subunit ribosomal protein S16
LGARTLIKILSIGAYSKLCSKDKSYSEIYILLLFTIRECFLLAKIRKIAVKSHTFQFQILIGGSDMVIIRLARGGAKKSPFFNMVVADSRNPRDGKFIERIGFYNPSAMKNEEGLRVRLDRITYWQSQGAQLSDTVTRLVKQFGKQKTAANS